MSEQSNLARTDDKWSCTTPVSGLVQLGSSHNHKIVQVSCAVQTTIKLPDSPLYGFSCLMAVVSAASNLVLDANGQTLSSCLNGISGTTLSNPAVGSRLQLRCDGLKWYATCDYVQVLPLAQTATSVTLTPTNMHLISPTTTGANTLGLGSASAAKGRFSKLTSGTVSSSDGSLVISGTSVRLCSIQIADDNSPDVSKSSSASSVTITNAIGDAFVIASNGSNWFVSGSSLGAIAVAA